MFTAKECVSYVRTRLYFLALSACVRPQRGPVWFREPLSPFIAEEWRLFTLAAGVRALTSIRSLWLVKMQFLTCSRLEDVWRRWSRGTKTQNDEPINTWKWLISHFCQRYSSHVVLVFIAEAWRALYLVRFNHKAFPLLLQWNSTTFWRWLPFTEGRWFLSYRHARIYRLVQEFKARALTFHASAPGSVFICLHNILLLPVCAVWCGQ